MFSNVESFPAMGQAEGMLLLFSTHGSSPDILLVVKLNEGVGDPFRSAVVVIFGGWLPFGGWVGCRCVVVFFL